MTTSGKVGDDELNGSHLKLSEDDISTNEADWISIVHCLKKKHIQNVAIGYLNINSLRNKFDNSMGLIGNAIDVHIFAETKLDSSFPKGQFKIPGYKQPNRFDMSSNVCEEKKIRAENTKWFNFYDQLKMEEIQIL